MTNPQQRIGKASSRRNNPMARVSTGKAATGRIGAKMVPGGMYGESPARYKGKPNVKGTAMNRANTGKRKG